MTIEVSILNKSQDRLVEVEFHDKSYSAELPDHFSSAGEVPAGEQKSFWIHDHRYVVVKEK